MTVAQQGANLKHFAVMHACPLTGAAPALKPFSTSCIVLAHPFKAPEDPLSGIV